jgi:PIN domain nuclease of toxin-antitoxin system
MAYLHLEPGADVALGLLDAAVVSTVNISEVAAKLIERGASEVHARAVIEDVHVPPVAFDEELAHRAASLRTVTRSAGLSFGDRACRATAQALGARAVTADKRWARLRVGVPVNVIR